MKKLFFILIMTIFMIVGTYVQAEVTDKKVVYFHSSKCGVCTSDIFKTKLLELEQRGIEIVKYDLINNDESNNENNINLMYSYAVVYGVPKDKTSVPLLFAGDKYFQGYDIIDAINNGTIESNSVNPLKEVDPLAYKKFVTMDFWGTIYVFFSGFLDGFNPCALAMLLMFISLLGFTTKKRILISVSISYISGLFLTYFALGTILFSVFDAIDIGPYVMFINLFIIALSVVLFILNLHDFIVAKREDYGKVKNQLPKGIQKFNKKIIKYFSKKLEEGSILIYVFPFLLGVILSMTEFMCTGQIYLPVIISLIQYSESLNIGALFYLFMYNVFFVLPLIVVAVVAIKTTSVFGTSDFIRKNLHWIKLFNALLFFGLGLYYILVVLRVL